MDQGFANTKSLQNQAPVNAKIVEQYAVVFIYQPMALGCINGLEQVVSDLFLVRDILYFPLPVIGFLGQNGEIHLHGGICLLTAGAGIGARTPPNALPIFRKAEVGTGAAGGNDLGGWQQGGSCWTLAAQEPESQA